jgi:tetratricopeptide (TPR) repeat protein
VSLSSVHFTHRALFIALGAAFFLTSWCQAQGMGGGQQAIPRATSTDLQQTELHNLTDVQRQPGVKIDPKEQSAYDAFYHVNSDLPDKKIQLGRAFLAKYPTSIFTEAVDAGLVEAYYQKQDWNDFYVTADKALALKPDDVDILATVGWVIPHVYNPHDDNADQQLAKAEACEKHAIELLGTIPKPAGLTDDQFNASKAQELMQAHSALGLVYFRREDYAGSSAELQQSMQNNPRPDPTDLYVLGIDFQNLSKFSEAADAFGRCALAPGDLQDRCKQSADQAQRQAAQPRR